jgi:hypothetical protein
MATTHTRLSDHIDVFYGASDRTSDGAMAAHAYKRSVEELDAVVQRELDAPYRTTIMEPLGKMNAYFPVINEHISKRNKKVSSRSYSTIMPVTRISFSAADRAASRRTRADTYALLDARLRRRPLPSPQAH